MILSRLYDRLRQTPLLFWVGLTCLVPLLLLAGLWVSWLPGAGKPEFSVHVRDQQGKLLRLFTTRDGYWRLPTDLARIDPQFIKQLLACEDKRFWHHPGVDIFALFRAGGQLLTHGRIISGASTITMQTVRLLHPQPRSLWRKAQQMLQALQLEARLGKKEILELYLALAPYGGNIQGIEAATRLYFGKTAAHLSTSEIALLISLPQSPERRRPDRHRQQAMTGRDAVLSRLHRAGLLAEDQLHLAISQPVPEKRLALPFVAPHLAENLRNAHPQDQQLVTTIDGEAQQKVEGLVAQMQQQLEKGMTLAVLVADRDGRVKVHVGSGDFHRVSQIDLSRAIRSPGSTFKPFIYGLGFEQGIIHPETFINDQPEDFGSYRPQNFTKSFLGWVSIREALQRSLNIPAVKVLRQIGPNTFDKRLETVGVHLHTPEGPALPLALGGTGTSLTDLVLLYSALANRGFAQPLRYLADDTRRTTSVLLSQEATWYVDDILRGTPLPAGLSGGKDLRFKTGTSFGFRDAWAIGYTGQYVVGIWLGRPDGGYGKSGTGSSLAVPAMLRVLAALPQSPAKPADERPAGVLVAQNHQLPKALQYLGESATVGERDLPRIFFPPDGSRVQPVADGNGQPVLVLKANGGIPPFTWLVDGRPLGDQYRGSIAQYCPEGGGASRITLIDGKGKVDRADIWIEEQHEHQ